MGRWFTHHLRRRLQRFRRDETGTVVTETVIMFPILFAAVISTFVFFDAFRNQSINLKATYTISDAISREPQTITNRYIVNTWRLHRFLSNSKSLTRLRITVVRYEETSPGEGTHTLAWSIGKGGAGQMTQGELNTLSTGDKIPVMADGGVMIIVQSWVDYTPNFSVGLGSFVFENTVYTRPRFPAAEQLCYSPDGSFTNRQCPIGS